MEDVHISVDFREDSLEKICKLKFKDVQDSDMFKRLDNNKASILQCSACFTVHLSQPYVTTGKTIALTIWTFVSKVMSVLFNK